MTIFCIAKWKKKDFWQKIFTHEVRKVPCDHSDGRRYAIAGAHDLQEGGMRMPITEVRYPPGAPFREGRRESHDFALMVLQQPLKWSAEGRQWCQVEVIQAPEL